MNNFFQVANHTPPTQITTLFRNDPFNGIQSLIFDTLTVAVWYKPSLILNSTTLYVDINVCQEDENYGQVIWNSPSINNLTLVKPLYGQSEVVFRVHNDDFYHLFVDLLTRQTPVRRPLFYFFDFFW